MHLARSTLALRISFINSPAERPLSQEALQLRAGRPVASWQIESVLCSAAHILGARYTIWCLDAACAQAKCPELL
jgi:acyl-coenzyme A thioesterase PaaI-like protein